MSSYEMVCGIEVHVELHTNSKMFCGCPVRFGAEPNTLTCPVCLGLPGSLPVPNRQAIESLIRIGLALDCEIAAHSVFHRKNYFYPDMPKNYQISQYDLPVAVGGRLDVETSSGTSRVGIIRAHMEEDTGKSTHAGSGRIHGAAYALIDFNRAGTPLVEVVSAPDIRSPEEARAYAQELHALVAALDVSEARLEAGQFRFDANVSLRRAGETTYGTRVEVKNLNSFRSLERALAHERDRQAGVLDAGGAVTQETRHWDEDAGVTRSMRAKEEAFDYRYFADPDLVPLEPGANWIDAIRASMPELPAARRQRYIEADARPADALMISRNPQLTAVLDASLADNTSVASSGGIVANDIARVANRYSDLDISRLGYAVRFFAVKIDSGELSRQQASIGIDEVADTGEPPELVVSRLALEQVSDEAELQAMVERLLAANPAEAARYAAGDDKLAGFFVGQVMRETSGKANARLVSDLLRRTARR